MAEDNWKGRSEGMRCRTCIYYVDKVVPAHNERLSEEANALLVPESKGIGRCRRHAPTMKGFPVVFETDWCGDHKLDEGKV